MKISKIRAHARSALQRFRAQDPPVDLGRRVVSGRGPNPWSSEDAIRIIREHESVGDINEPASPPRA